MKGFARGAGRPGLALAALALAAACRQASPPPVEAPELRFEAVSGDRVAQGERLSRVLGCRGCHGEDLTGHVWEDDPRVAVLYTSNLRRAVPRYDDAALERTLRYGRRPDGSSLWAMPSEIFTHLSAADMDALIAWLRTLPEGGPDHPRLAFGPEGRRLVAQGELKSTPQWVREARTKASPSLDGRHEWARYMIRATCSECHGLDLAGTVDPGDRSPPPDLIVAGGYGREQFRHLLRTGEPVGGRRLGLMAEVARGRFAHLTEREVDAIYDYLVARARRPQ